MKRFRHLPTFAILAVYVAQIMGGQALHLWQCSGNAGACCSVDVGQTLGHSHQHDGHCHPKSDVSCKGQHSHHSASESSKSDSPTDDSSTDREGERHDSSSCWVCQVLAQAQETCFDVSPVISFSETPGFVLDLPEFYPTPFSSGIQSRGPPTELA